MVLRAVNVVAKGLVPQSWIGRRKMGNLLFQ